MTDSDYALKPLASSDGTPVFDEAWQAQALAIADSLVKQGLFSASEWSESLGQFLRDAEDRDDADTQLTYYECVLKALESLIASHSDINQQAMTEKRKDWEAAYLSTAHGKPVNLK